MSEWIKIGDKLPPLMKYVLCKCAGHKQPVVMRRLAHPNTTFQEPFGLMLLEVTHWQPLPEPPKDET